MIHRLHILFVCMDASAKQILSKTLSEGGWSVEAASIDEPKQLDAALTDTYNLVLVDSLFKHPKLVGQIHELMHKRDLDIPVLVYSSAEDEDAIVIALKAGAKDFISNSNPKRLLPAVKRELTYVQQRMVRRKQDDVDALLQKIDSWMLQGLDVETLTLRICEHALFVFDLQLVWVGGKQTDGTINVVAAVGEVAYLRDKEMRWDDERYAQCPVSASIAAKQARAATVDAPSYAPCKTSEEQHGIKSIAALPMVVRDEVIGTLVLYSAKRDAFDTASLKRYQGFINRVAINIFTSQEDQQFRLLNAAINNATQAIFITDHRAKIVWFNHALSVISGYEAEEIMGSTPHMFSSGNHTSHIWDEMWLEIQKGTDWTGDVVNRRKQGTLYSVLQSITPLYNDQGQLTHFLSVQQDVSEKKEMEQKIAHLAYHDTLTGLPNRSLFNDRMQQAITQSKRDKSKFSLLFIDLDGFKEVNDTYGHAVGDMLLKVVAERLTLCVREGDTVARLGGDEFIVLLRATASERNLVQIAAKIIDRVGTPYELGNYIARVTASIGISRYPSDASNAETLMSYADEAMYQAKHTGKNRYSLWHKPSSETFVSDWQI